MKKIPTDYFNKLYSGWLGKLIGIRLGAAIEGWTYDKIKNVYGTLTDYPIDYKDFAADDDSNGPIFFIRALEDCKDINNMSAQDVGDALLNYASFEHGFFWWGGYGVSTEHTAYLNLKNGIQAPRSGSIEQNGKAVAEQIGGQIFIDSWGLVAPGNPELAAKYAQRAASVTHDGNGIYGGIFIAVCVSLAFVENDIQTIIDKALTYIPVDCEYARVVNAVKKFYKNNPSDWRACYTMLFENFGYDKYPGACHIIPNSGVIILALLYGQGDFTNSINICNMCGWDTDCNVANVGCIIGVMNGIEGIDYNKWAKPINDFLACSGAIGSLNIMDIPYGASYMAKLAYKLADEKIPEEWKTLIENKIDSCHFEYPTSTHAIRTRGQGDFNIVNSDEAAFKGKRSLKVTAFNMARGENAYIFKKTYYTSSDFHDSRYDPSFSPIVYPGQTLNVSAMLAEYSDAANIKAYVKDGQTGEIITGENIFCEKNKWHQLSMDIPSSCARIDEAGVMLTPDAINKGFDTTTTIFMDELYFSGKPNYSIDFAKENLEIWSFMHKEVSQFTYVKGLFYLEDEKLSLSCGDFGKMLTGGYDWADYTFSADITPIVGENHYLEFCVQGCIRSYAIGFSGKNKIALMKNIKRYEVLKEIDFEWAYNKKYNLCVTVNGNKISIKSDGKDLLSFTDNNNPYLYGCIGISVSNGSHGLFSNFKIC